MGHNKMKTYLLNVLVAFDVFMSTVLGFSQADITISSCCGLALRHKTGYLERHLGMALNWCFPGHTTDAISSDIARAESAYARLIK